MIKFLFFLPQRAGTQKGSPAEKSGLTEKKKEKDKRFPAWPGTPQGSTADLRCREA